MKKTTRVHGSIHSTMAAVGVAVLFCLTASPGAWAQTTWDAGGGVGDTSWGSNLNWNNDSLPNFNGTDALTVLLSYTDARRNVVLGANRSIGTLTFGTATDNAANACSLGASGSILTLRSTSSTASAPQLMATASDKASTTFNADMMLDAVAGAGSYTAYWKQGSGQGSSGIIINGKIYEQTGQNWTIIFDESGRNQFQLKNAANSVSAMRTDGATVYSSIPGAFGTAPLTLNGGSFGVNTVDHFTGSDAVANNLTLSIASSWNSAKSSRLTGSLTQGANALTYVNSQVHRLEFSSISGTGTTTVRAGALSVSSMSQLSSATLNIGENNTTFGGVGAFVLSGSNGNGVPTWDEFRTARAYNQSGGAGTWRINDPPAGQSGGFAARGADVTIPHQTAANAGGLTSATFSRQFGLGSIATVDAQRYADKAVRVETDIVFPAATYQPVIAWNTQVTRSGTAWTFGGPIHELAGSLTGNNVLMIPITGGATQYGMVRVTNTGNNLTGTSAWLFGSSRNAWTTPGGIATGGGNHNDTSGAVGIFTSDAAFGGSGVEVGVVALGSSGSSGSGFLFFEDVNGSGSTTFTKSFFVRNNTAFGAGFGSWGGDVIYEGTITLDGTDNSGYVPIHVNAGSTMQMGGSLAATLTNNREDATVLNKGGIGTLILSYLSIGGTQTSYSWNIYNGAIRETGSASESSMVDRNVRLRGGVIEFGAPPRAITLGTGNGNVDMNVGGGGGFSAFGSARTVSLNGGVALTWDNTADFLSSGQPLVLGSRTANAMIEFPNSIALNTAVRTVRVEDNPDTTGDMAKLSGALTGTGSSGITKTGTGILELSGGNSYAGVTTVSAGTLVAGIDALSLANGAFGNASSAILLTDANTGTDGVSLLINGAYTVGRAVTVQNNGTGLVTIGGNADANSAFSGTITLSKNVQLTSASMGANAVTVSGQITGGAYAVTKVGSGALVLSSATSDYSGTTTISAGSLVVGANAPNGSAGSFGNATSAILLTDANTGANDVSLLIGGAYTVGRSVTVQANGTGLVTLGGSSDADSVFAGDVILNKDVRVTSVTTGSRTVALNGIIGDGAGIFGLAKIGSGSVALANGNTYDGRTVIQEGTLVLSGEGGLGANPAGSVSDQLTLAGGTLRTTATFALDDSNRGVTLNSGTQTISVDSSTTFTIANLVTGAGNLTKTGAGTLVLSDSGNAYSGKTTVSVGTLSVGAEQNLGANPLSLTADHLTLNGGTLRTTATFALDDSNRGVTLNSGTQTISVDDATTFTVAAIVTGAGALSKTGTGTLALTAANDYSDETTVSLGTLLLGSGGSIGASDVTVASGATLGNATMATRTVGGALAFSSGALASFEADGDTDVVGKITVSGNVTLNGNAITVHVGGSSPLAVGTYRLVECTGGAELSNASAFGAPTITGAGVDGTALITVVPGVNGYIALSVTSGSTPTTTTIGYAPASGSPSTYGNSVTFRAQVVVTADSSPVTLGTVTFKDGANVLQTGVALDLNGYADYATGALTHDGGTPHSIVAYYVSEAPFEDSDSEGAPVSHTVNRRPVTLTGARIYNGTTSVLASQLDVSPASIVGSDAVDVSTGSGAVASKAVGSRAITDFGDLTLGGAQADNYTLSGAAGSVTISTKDVTISDVTAADKPYDGSPTAALSGGTVTGKEDGDDVGIAAGTGSFADSNAGLHGVTASGYGLNGADADNYALSAQPVVPDATIDPRPVSLSGTRVYDGTADASAAILSIGNKVGLDDVTVASGTATLASKDFGARAITDPSGLALGGVHMANYALVGANGSVNITAKPLAITGVAGVNRVYDATTTASLSGTPALLAASNPGEGTLDDGKPYSGDTVSVDGSGTGTFADRHVADNKSVTVAGFTLSGGDAGNYTPTQPVGVTANVTPKALTIAGVTANNKPFDGSTTATLSGTAAFLTAEAPGAGNTSDGKPYTGDTVSLSGTPSANFNDASIGTAKPVTVTGYTVGGAQGGNYSATQPVGLTANITPPPIQWNGSSSTDWATGGNWDGGTAPADDTTTALAKFNSTFATQPDAGTRSVAGIQVGTSLGQALTIGGTQLTLGANGIDSTTASQTIAINPNVVLAGNQTWSVANAVTLNGTLSGTGNLTKGGAGTVTFGVLDGVTHVGNTTVNAGFVTYNYARVDTPATDVNTSFGSGTITLNGGRFTLNQSGATSGAMRDVRLLNNIIVTAAGGSLGGSNVNGNQLRANVAGDIDLGGLLTFGKFSGGGNSDSIILSGQITINSAGASVVGNVSNPKCELSSPIQDGTHSSIAFGHSNSGNGTSFLISTPAASMTYSGDTTILGSSDGLGVPGQFIEVGASSRLNGNITVNNGGWLRLDSASNVQSGKKVTVLQGANMTAVVFVGETDFGSLINGSASTGSYFLGLDGNNNTASVNLAALTSSGTVVLGVPSGATANFYGSLTAAGLYNLGAGGSSGSLVLHGANALTGNNNVTVGGHFSALGNDSKRGCTVTLVSANNLVGTITVSAGASNYSSTLAARTSGAFGSGNGITLTSSSSGSPTLRFETNAQTHDNPITISGTATANITANQPTTLTAGIVQGGASTLNANGSSVLILSAAASAPTGKTTVSSGILSLSNMNQIGDSNLNLAGGALVLDGVAWSAFGTDRSLGYGTGDNQWRLTGGGFAARGSNLVMPDGSAGMTTASFDLADLNLGSVLTVSGVRYANYAVKVGQATSYTTASQRDIWLAGSCVKSTTEWTIAEPVHEFSGAMTGTDVKIAIMGAQRDGNNIGALRLSGNNSFSGASSLVIGGKRSNFTTPAGRTFTTGNSWDNGGAVLIVTSDSAFGGADEVLVYCAGSDTGAVGSMLLFEDTVGGTSFGRTFEIYNSTTTRGAGFGSYAGTVNYGGTVNLTQASADLPMPVVAGTLELGTAGDQADIVNNRTAAVRLNKSGSGTLILSNLVFGGTQAGNDWVVYGGALRETGAVGANSGLDRNVSLRGGVLEFGAAPRALTLGTASGQINLNAGGGGGFSVFGADRTLNFSNGTLTWNTSPFVKTGDPLVFGSQTANAKVTLQNDIALAAAVREIRVLDNAGSTADMAELSGALTGTGSAGVNKTGSGTLILSGANTYAGVTTVSAGTLLVNNSLNAGGGAVTVADGATLGGGGSILRAVELQGAAVLEPGSFGPGMLTVESLTLGASNVLNLELGTASDKVVVNGALTLDGTLNIVEASGFGAGIYELMTYDQGQLTDSGLALGTTPDGFVYVLTVAAGKVTLTVGNPAIALSGNSNPIPNGADETDVAEANNTHFGLVKADLGSGGLNADRTFVIANSGLVPLNLNGTPRVALSGAGSAHFSVQTPPALDEIPAAGNTTFTLRFAPTALGDLDATVTIASDDPDDDPYTFVIRGTGTEGGPEIEVRDPDDVALTNGSGVYGYGTLTGGALDKVFTIRNDGAANLALSGNPIVALSGHTADFTLQAAPSTLVAAGNQTTFTLRFAPKELGVRQATVSIAHSGDNTGTPFTFTVEGTFEGPEMDLRGKDDTAIASGDGTPTTVKGTDFGALAVYNATLQQTFTIENDGLAALVLGANPVSVGGAHPGDFLVTQPDPTTVPAGDNVTFTVTFNPTAAGPLSAVVSIANSDPNEAPYTFAVAGEGLIPTMYVLGKDDEPIASGDVTPTTVKGTDYGTIPANQTLDQVFTIGNSDTVTDLVLTGTPKVEITGANPLDFEVTVEPAGTVTPAATTTFTLRFAPKATGTRNATVSIVNTDTAKTPYTFAVQGQATVATVAWDGGGGADTSWGTAANWAGDVLPAFNGAEEATITAGFGANTALVLDGDRALARLTFGGGGTAISLGAPGETLSLTKTDTSAAAGAALWNASTGDGQAAAINANVLLQAGSSGSYTGHFRENNNSSGGTHFHGAVTQAPGENWTLRFSKGSVRSRFLFYNPNNDVSILRNDDFDNQGAVGLISAAPGGFGSASLHLNGGVTGTGVEEQFTAGKEVSNPITLLTSSSWASLVPSRLTGDLTQGGFQITYGGTSLTHLDRTLVTASGKTVVSGGAISVAGMNQLSSGNLELSGGVFILGDTSWVNFTAGRSGGYGTGANQWQITGSGGGFAARGQDVTISGGGSGDFNRDFTLGSAINGVDGQRYARHAIAIAQPISFTAGTRFLTVIGESTDSSDNWTVTGAVNEFSGVLSDGGNAAVLAFRSSDTAGRRGILRVSNPVNSFTSAGSVWLVGGRRSGFTTPGGKAIAANNAFDSAGLVLVVSSDAAFGGVNEVVVYGSTSSGAQPDGMLLFENQGGGTLEFARNFNVHFGNGYPSDDRCNSGFGSYQGSVLYRGTVTLSADDIYNTHTPIHVQAGELILGKVGMPATILNNRDAAASSKNYNKGGAGTLVIQNLTYGNGSYNGTLNWVVLEGAIREMGSTDSGGEAANTDSLAGRNVSLRGGVLEFGATPRALTLGTGAGQINMGADGGGGFSAYGADRTVNLGGAAAAVEWAAGNFVANGGPLIFGSPTASGKLSFANPIGLANASNSTVTRTIRVDDNTSSSGDSAEMTGSIRNRGDGTAGGTGTRSLVKTGAGTLVLSGSNNDYNGTTAVSAGALIVNGTLSTSLSAVTVAAGATLGGGGTINRPVVVENGGTVAAGSGGIGVLTTSGLTLGATSTNRVDLAASADRIVVNGDLTLGGTIDVVYGSSLSKGRHEILSYTGNLSGNLPAVSYVHLTNMEIELIVDTTAKKVYLDVRQRGTMIMTR